MVPLKIPGVSEASDRCYAVVAPFLKEQQRLANDATMTRDEKHTALEACLLKFANDLKTLDGQEAALVMTLLVDALGFTALLVFKNIEDAILLHKFGEQAKSQLEAFKQN